MDAPPPSRRSSSALPVMLGLGVGLGVVFLIATRSRANFGPPLPATPDNPDLSWRETGRYPRGALVTHQGQFFTATTPSGPGPGNSVSPGGPQTALFWRPGMVPIAWDASTSYAFGDEVEYKAQRYQFGGATPTAAIAPDRPGADNPWSVMGR